MLFGHQNDDTAQPAGTPPPPPAPTDNTSVATPSVNPLAVDTETGVGLPTTQEDMSLPTDLDASASTATPTENTTSAPEVVQESPAIFETTPDPVESVEPTAEASVSTAAPTSASDTNQADLLSLKQQALAQLSPLVSQLEQSPEEKFRTTMMLLQSTDNSALIKDAYDAARAIPDEKARAQALLDIVNEINYFTQQK